MAKSDKEPKSKGRRGRSKTAPETINTRERRRVVLELRIGGATHREIRDALLDEFGPDRLPKGYDELYVAKDIIRELERWDADLRESAEQIRTMELERLDRLWFKAYEMAEEGDLTAIDRCLKIMARRAKLLGIDSPTKISLGDEELDAAIERELAKLAARRQAGSAE